MKTATPQEHGERRYYLRGCRCHECADAHYRYMSRYRLDKHRGQRRLEDAQPVIEHMQALGEAGWNLAQISRASGVGHRTIVELAAGKHRTTSPARAQAILAVPIGPAPESIQFTDATGTIRRLRALAAIGYSMQDIAPLVDINPSVLRLHTRAERSQVRATTATAVKAAYRTLSRLPGPSNRERVAAKRKGWHGPLAWDDVAIDDPGAQPETSATETKPNRDELAAVRRAEIEHLDSFGLSEYEIGARLDMNPHYVRAIAQEIRTGQRRDRQQTAAA